MVLPKVHRDRFTNGRQRQTAAYKGRILVSQIVQILISNFKGSVKRVSLLCNSLQHWLQLTWIQAGSIQPQHQPRYGSMGYNRSRLQHPAAKATSAMECLLHNLQSQLQIQVKKHSSLLLNSCDICFIYYKIFIICIKKEECHIKHYQEIF